MRVVIDTNILLQSIARKSRMRPIWDTYLNEDYSLIVTSSILLEYEEKIAEKASAYVATNITSLITEALNSVFTEVYYEWKIIAADADDNKFFDAAVAGNVDYLVTNDAHFNVAKLISFPKVNIVSGDEFLSILERKGSSYFS